MPVISLILRLIALVALITVGTIWFLHKDEWNAILEQRERLETTFELEEQPLSESIRASISSYEEERRQRQAAVARGDSLDRELAQRTQQRDEARESLRVSRTETATAIREKEQVQSELETARQTIQSRENELNATREDLIAARRANTELRDRRDELQSEVRRLELAVRAAEERAPSQPGAPGADPQRVTELEAEVANLNRRLQLAQEQVQRLRDTADLATLVTDPDFDAATLSAMGIRALKVGRVSQQNRLVMLIPYSADLVEVGSQLRLFQKGVEIARIRVQEASPQMVVANVLPESFFPERLERGTFVEFRR